MIKYDKYVSPKMCSKPFICSLFLQVSSLACLDIYEVIWMLAIGWPNPEF